MDSSTREAGKRVEVSIPAIMRQAEIRSFDDETRTAALRFSVGARVRRWDWVIGDYYEEVSMDPEAADLTRVEKGAVPFLKNHGSIWGATIEDVMGNVLEASVDGKEGAAQVRFSSREEIQPYIQDIKDGILKSVSMGYWPRSMEKIAEEDGVPVFRVTKWELGEISSVAMPADADASFRSMDGKENGRKPRLFKCEVRGFDLPKPQERVSENQISQRKEVENKVDPSQDRMTGDKSMDEKTGLDVAEQKRLAEKAKEEGAKEERERQKQIRRAVSAAGLEDAFADELVDGGKSVDEAREAVIDKLAARDKSTSTRAIRVEAGDLDEVDTRRGAMKEAILFRGSPVDEKGKRRYELTERARDWAGLSLLEMARESLRLQGVKSHRMSRIEVATRAMHSTSDFPEITADIINKSLRDAFMLAPQTFAPFTRRVQNPDFKQISRVQLGSGSELEEVLEGGEIKEGTVGEGAEKYEIKEYARKLTISRKTLVNDDLDAFVRLPAAMGAKARSLESKLVWAIFTSNPAMADSVALFNAAHGNQAGSPGAPSLTTLGAARAAMRSQKDLDGEPLTLAMRWLIVPVALETVAEQFIAQVQPNAPGDVNPFAQGGRTPLGLIVEPRLDADSLTKWYGAASVDQVDMIELATLSGTTEPEVLSDELFDSLGMKFRVVHSVGAKAIDYRGLYRNS